MKAFCTYSAILAVVLASQACGNQVSEEDLKDSIEVIRAADSMLKIDAARDTLPKDGTIKDSSSVGDSLQH